MPACKMPHARYVGSDKRSLGGTWQRINHRRDLRQWFQRIETAMTVFSEIILAV